MICSWIWTSTHPASYKVCTIVSQLGISSTQDKWITDSQVAGPCCARANCFMFAGIWRGRDVWVQSEWSKLPVNLIHQTVKLIHLWSINIRTRGHIRTHPPPRVRDSGPIFVIPKPVEKFRLLWFLWFQSQSRTANTIYVSNTINSAINESSSWSTVAASPNPL